VTECSRLDELLEVDVDVLVGEGDSELAGHIRGCSHCAEAARAIRASTARLEAVLATPSASLDVDALLARARLDAAPAPTRERYRWARWAVPAAAVLAGLWAIGDRDPPLPGRATPAARTEAALPLVESSPGRDVAVMPTNDPDITILWFFPGE
jgi:hypothetical protein